MEEIEQLCTRIAVIDAGKLVAIGTKEELKAMISQGEKVVVEVFSSCENYIEKIKEIPNVADVECHNNLLTIKSKSGVSNITKIVSYINENNISYGKIYSELPTLNDVFLEITGKELRD